MAITSLQNDKFAFLFTSSANEQFVNDIRKVLETLIDYYGYMPENITVVSGEEIPDFSVPDPPDPDNIFHTDGLTKIVLTGADAVEITDNFQVQVENFLFEASFPVNPPHRNCSFMYFTGTGTSVTSPLTNYYLQIGSIGANPVKINQAWLPGIINGFTDFTDNNHLNVVMQQSYSYGFWDGIGGLANVSNINTEMSFTAAADTNEPIDVSPAAATGSAFTDFWKDAMQLVHNGSVYPDQVSTDATSPEPVNNFLVSMKKAFIYAKVPSGLNSRYEYKGSSEQYLGLPAFLIRDGDQNDPPDSWWESPDIFLTHPDNPDPDLPDDTYHPGVDNEINIRVFNTGTHPVRQFWIGSIVFLSGGGGVGDSVVNIVSVVLKPGEEFIHSYLYDFSAPETHRCARARVQLDTITLTQINQDGVDDIAWAVTSKDNEAQRNLDPIQMKKSSAAPAEPDTATADEANAEAEAAPDDTNDENAGQAISLANLRGLKEHVYTIRNIFKKTRKFRVVFPENYLNIKRSFSIHWFEMPGSPKAKPVIIKTKDVRQPYFDLLIEPGKVKKLLLYIAVNQKTVVNGPVKIPFEILVDTKAIKAGLKKELDTMGFNQVIPDFLSFAGVTVLVTQVKPASIFGRALDKSGKPLAGNFVIISTLNGRQSAIVKTDPKGYFKAGGIDPDFYRFVIMNKVSRSQPVTFKIKPGAGQRIDLRMITTKEKQKVTGKRK